ncbi:hypothetical protein F4803DRAFT_414413 [Xylaria telfairii]|nr:hypothetical protein F4803DRAFT_414413 [Xylaria telfairii]
MPKWDKTRDYYADLELQTSATPDEIKRQFKKLALKYHPDRNPGKEAEVNPKFQIIQSAHEILTDETLRRQYDEARRSYTARYPTASGVKGNPWQDVGKAYPPPPRRQPNAQNRSKGAQRYENFADGMPRHARPQSPKDDPQFRRSNADAWDHLRPNRGRSNASSRPATPGRGPPGRAPTSAARDSRPGPNPTPPRTAYQKQKAEAAFGTSKKTGFTPRSPSVADEPPVTNKNYFTNRTHSNLFTEPVDIPQPSNDAQGSVPVDPIPPFRDRFLDRQRTPYHTPGGEKTSPFDSNPGLGRSTSTRMPSRGFEVPGAFPRARPRSTSPTRSSSNDGGSEDSIKVNTGVNGATNRNSPTAQPRGSERYKPKMPAATEGPPRPAPHGKLHGAQLKSVGSLIERPTDSSSGSAAAQSNGTPFSAYDSRDWLSHITSYHPLNPSSEESNPHDPAALLPLEMHQRKTLDRLVRNYSMAGESGVGNGHIINKKQHTSHDLMTSDKKVKANCNRTSSFNYPDGLNTARTDAGFKTFTRNSAESINTRFVDHEEVDDWQFKAGSASANDAIPPRARSQSRNRPFQRQKTIPKPAFSTPVPEAQESPAAGPSDQGFSAGMWDEQIGPQHFEPQSSNSASTSPTKRASLRKSKSFKMTAGTAAVVDEESEEYDDVHRPFTGHTSTVPDAMDIDTPPTEKAERFPHPVEVNSARKYSTEPYREDWRAGDANGVASKAGGPTPNTNGTNGNFPKTNGTQSKLGATNNNSLQHGGSEDSEEFRTTFSDFKNIEPFVDPIPSGLRSFADLKSTLPFESRPSEQIPLDIKTPPGPLEFPHPPVAPRLPPTMGVTGLRPNNSSFKKYAETFHNYMEKWEIFNNKVLAHFVTRQEEFKSRRLRRGANWLEDGVDDYLTEMDQDLDVQKKYVDACAEHRKRVAQFKEFRDRVC